MDKIANVSALRRQVAKIIIDTKQARVLTPEEKGYIKAMNRVVSMIDSMKPYNKYAQAQTAKDFQKAAQQ